MGKASSSTDRVIAQAGVVPYRFNGRGQLQVLLITNRAGQWIVPKGMIDQGATAEQAALIEALEEAGAVGHRVEEELGAYEYAKWGRVCRMRLFSMRVDRLLDKWLERSSRRREWFTLEEAAARVEVAGLKSVLLAFARRLADAA